MPNRPITAIRKSKPLSSSVKPKVSRSCPVTLSRPTAASAKPIIIAAMVLNGGSLPMPTKLQKARKYTANFSGGPNCSANFATSGATQRDHDHGEQRADERRGERGGQRLAGPALLRHRIAVERGRHRPRLARNVEQDRGDGAAEQRAPVDARQHDDRRGRRHEKVSGSRIATPLAPPRPGSTPMITPSRMPSTISMMLYGCSTTAKP